jgi:hypothetical protein
MVAKRKPATYSSFLSNLTANGSEGVGSMTTGAVGSGFRGFAGDPQSELEVAYLLGLA